MGFLMQEVRAEVAAKKPGRTASSKRSGYVPIDTMRQMGCRVCPQKDCQARTTRFDATGNRAAEIMVLWASPTDEDVDRGFLGNGPAAQEFAHYFKKEGTQVRQHAIVRCPLPDGRRPSLEEVECCRGYVVEEIEKTKPTLIIGVGEDALRWAAPTDKGNSMAFRGRVFPVKIGRHVCWFFPMLYPTYVERKNRKRRNEYEVTTEHDIRKAVYLAETLPAPTYVEGGYDDGVTIITGHEPGDLQRLEDHLHRLIGAPRVAVDYETNALRPFVDDPHIWTAAVGHFNDTVAFPLDHPDGWGTEGRQRQVRGMLGEFLLQSNRKFAHNLIMEQEWSMHEWGERVLRLTDWEDTMVQAFTIDGREGTKSLEAQTMFHFGFNVKAQSPIDVKRLLDYPIKQVLRYNGMDTKWTEAVSRHNDAILDSEPTLRDSYERRVRLIPALVLASAKGVDVDQKYAKDLLATMTDDLRQVERDISRCNEVKDYERRHGRFSPSNSDHVLTLMRDVCKRGEVEVVDRDGKVSYSTSEEHLSAIPEAEVKSAPLILKWRGIDKLRGTYLRPIAEGAVIAPDGKVHTQYSATRTITGRLSSDDPNLQNIPHRTAEGRRVRAAYYAKPYEWIAALDYGQIEARVIGMASEDPNLLRYQWTDYDIHGFWATRIADTYPKVKDWIVKTFSVDWDEKGHKTLRQETKNKWVFPQFFGSAARSCATDLHLPEEVADKLAAEFWDEFKGVKKWQTKLEQFYEKHLYVETLGGLRRAGPTSRNELINMPVQGTAAEIVTGAMTELSEMGFAEDDPELQPNLNIHDDLTFWLRDETLETKIGRIAKVMCRHRFDYIIVPLIVEVKVGNRWGSMEEIKVFKSNELFNLRNPYK